MAESRLGAPKDTVMQDLTTLRKQQIVGPDLVERELMQADRELQQLLGVLKTRRTKTLGRAMKERLDRACRAAKDVIERHFETDSAAHRLLKELAYGWRSTRLADVVANLESACAYFAELRLFYGQQRLKDAQQRVQQLQFSLDSSRQSNESRKDTAGQVKPGAVAKSSTVFVIMPFDESFSDVWAGAIQRAARSEGYEAIRVDMINRSSDITDDIIEAITNCHMAIVDVTGANANVMFELGYAFAKEKPQIIISQSAAFLPFDIRNLRTLVYRNTWAGIEELSQRLCEFLHETSRLPSRARRKGRGRTRRNASRYPRELDRTLTPRAPRVDNGQLAAN